MQALTERFEMRLDQDTLHTVDAWRSRQPDLPSRSEAIRRLIEVALTSAVPDKRPELRFSPGETLITHLLCDIVKAQKLKTQIPTEFVADALSNGHLWALEWQFPGIFHHHVDSRETLTEVVDILDMWNFIETDYEALTPKEKAQVAADAKPFGKDPKFPGFDGNNESEQLNIATFLTQEMDRFSRYKKRPDLNSHCPSLETHRRMYAVFEPMRRTLQGIGLSAAQIIQLLNARTHPENRKD